MKNHSIQNLPLQKEVKPTKIKFKRTINDNLKLKHKYTMIKIINEGSTILKFQKHEELKKIVEVVGPSLASAPTLVTNYLANNIKYYLQVIILLFCNKYSYLFLEIC